MFFTLHIEKSSSTLHVQLERRKQETDMEAAHSRSMLTNGIEYLKKMVGAQIPSSMGGNDAIFIWIIKPESQ